MRLSLPAAMLRSLPQLWTLLLSVSETIAMFHSVSEPSVLEVATMLHRLPQAMLLSLLLGYIPDREIA